MLDGVVVGAKLHVVADAHRRDDDAEIEGDLPADQADAVEQIAALGGIDEADQAVADFQFHGVEVEEFFDFFRLFFGGSFLFCRRRLWRASASLRVRVTASRRSRRQERSAGTLGKTGEHHQPDEYAGDDQGLGLGEKLAEHFVAEIGLAAGAGDDQAGGERNDEGGELADQPVADGQLGVKRRQSNRPQPCSNMPT